MEKFDSISSPKIIPLSREIKTRFVKSAIKMAKRGGKSERAEGSKTRGAFLIS